jgi:hypothetical protein
MIGVKTRRVCKKCRLRKCLQVCVCAHVCGITSGPMQLGMHKDGHAEDAHRWQRVVDASAPDDDRSGGSVSLPG